MALDNEQRKEREKEYQKKYRSSDKFKATRKRYEQSEYYRNYKRGLAERTRGEYYLEYQHQYQQTENYKESVMKYRQSDKYKERIDKSLIYTQFNDDGKNNDIPAKQKFLKTIENTMIEFTTEFIDDFCDKWIEWIEDSTFINDEGMVKFRRGEAHRINYAQYVVYYKRLTGIRVGLIQIENEYLNNEFFRERMREIDMLYEQHIESLMAQGIVNAISSKFILTNRFKDNWVDSKSIKSETTMTQMVNFSDSMFQLPKKEQPQELPKHIDYDEFEEVEPSPNDGDKNE